MRPLSPRRSQGAPCAKASACHSFAIESSASKPLGLRPHRSCTTWLSSSATSSGCWPAGGRPAARSSGQAAAPRSRRRAAPRKSGRSKGRSASSARVLAFSNGLGRRCSQPLALNSKRSFNKQRSRGWQLLASTISVMRSKIWFLQRHEHQAHSKSKAQGRLLSPFRSVGRRAHGS